MKIAEQTFCGGKRMEFVRRHAPEKVTHLTVVTKGSSEHKP